MEGGDDLFGEAKPADISDRQKLAELIREYRYRKHVYKRLIEKGRLGQPVAKERMLILLAIIRDYEGKIDANTKHNSALEDAGR